MKLDAEVLELIEGCIRLMLISLLGQFFGYILYDTMMERRRSIWPLVIFIAGRAVLMNVVLNVIFRFYFPGEDWVQQVAAVSGAVCSITACTLFIYVYDVSILKSVICMSVGEALVSLVWLPSIAFTNRKR